jgi:hypothetical protein
MQIDSLSLTNTTMKIININLDLIEQFLKSRSYDQLFVIDNEMKSEIKNGNAIGFVGSGLSLNEVSVFHDEQELNIFYNKFLESKYRLLFQLV